MRSFNLSTLAIAAFATTVVCLQPHSARAGGEGFSKDDLGGGKEIVDTKSYDEVGLGKFKANPWHIAVSLRSGYDDNVNLSDFDQQESWFTSLSAELTYNAGSPRTQIRLTVGGGVTYYWDQDDSDFSDNRDYDVNAYLSLSILHKATPRLTLGAVVYASYQTQPSFDTFANGGNFNRTNQNYFYSLDKFTLGYLWAPRFATATSYTLGVTQYENNVGNSFQDRYEHTFGNEFRFLLTPTTTLVAEYRFGIVDYTDTDTDARNSTSHYLLGGFDHSFNPRFSISARGGVEFRMFDDNAFENDITNPYGELTLQYAVSKGTQISWSNRYSLEAPSAPEAFTSKTFRSALSLRHAFTSRITGGLSVAYQHINNLGALGFDDFDEDDIYVAVMLRYAINRTWAVDAGYEFTDVISPDSFTREFTRNRVWGGATFTW